MPLKPKELAKMFEKAGFVLDRIKGSHYIYVNESTKETVSIPMHNKDLKTGLEKALLKRLKAYGGSQNEK